MPIESLRCIEENIPQYHHVISNIEPEFIHEKIQSKTATCDGSPFTICEKV